MAFLRAYRIPPHPAGRHRSGQRDRLRPGAQIGGAETPGGYFSEPHVRDRGASGVRHHQQFDRQHVQPEAAGQNRGLDAPHFCCHRRRLFPVDAGSRENVQPGGGSEHRAGGAGRAGGDHPGRTAGPDGDGSRLPGSLVQGTNAGADPDGRPLRDRSQSGGRKGEMVARGLSPCPRC